eukprot:SM000103S09467  [mRNA]  locus=s103:34713:36072:+ [translate_table: standard]
MRWGLGPRLAALGAFNAAVYLAYVSIIQSSASPGQQLGSPDAEALPEGRWLSEESRDIVHKVKRRSPNI